MLSKKGASSWDRHKTVMVKNLRMGRRGFGHAFSCAKSSFRGMNPNPSYWIWMCCLLNLRHSTICSAEKP